MVCRFRFAIFVSAPIPDAVTIPRLICRAEGRNKRALPESSLSRLLIRPKLRNEEAHMRIFRHPGGSMIMVGFLSRTASGQDATQVAKQGPTHAPMANAVAATVNGQAIMEQSLQRGLKRLPAEKQAAARTAI